MNMQRLLLPSIVLFSFACTAEPGNVDRDPDAPPSASDPSRGNEALDPACDEELSFFEEQVDTPILSVRCIGCHNADGVAKETDLLLKADDGLHNFRAASRVARKTAFGRSVLLLKPSLTHPEGHTGGELVPIGSPEYAALESFVEVATDPSCNPPVPESPTACDAPAPGPRLLRRLSRSEYVNTVRDLLGVEVDPSSFATDEIVDGFDNDAEALIVSPLLADQYRESAEEIAGLVDLAGLVPCDPQSGTEACARSFIETFGRSAFRRPLAQEEITRYTSLFSGIAGIDGFSEGIRWVLTAMLQSPSFLYRRELGRAEPGSDRYTLDPWEIASALSYGITGTMPDEALLRAAQAGELSTPEQIAAQAERLFSSPAALGSAERFVSQWLEIDTLETVPKDMATFPELDRAMRARLRKETETFVAHVLQDGSGTLDELLTADYSFADPELAAFYGFELPAGGVERDGLVLVSYAPEHQAGLLTQGSFLATHARPNGSSPVHRGVVVRERILCQDLPPPPPGVNAEPPAPDPNQTTRERYSAHSADPACASCHRLIDPIGFGFERFDGIGRLTGVDADDSGEIIESGGSTPFTGTRGLAAVLADRADVADCFARQWLRFTYGTPASGDLACTLQNVQDAFRTGGGQIEALVAAAARAPHFRIRIGAPAEPSSADPDPDPPPEEEPEMPPEMPRQDLAVDVRVDSDWGAGYCHQVTVTNQGPAPLDWSLALDVEGTINTHWNAITSGDQGRVTFEGVDFNDVIGPGEGASFGFCADR